MLVAGDIVKVVDTQGKITTGTPEQLGLVTSGLGTVVSDTNGKAPGVSGDVTGTSK